MNRLKELRDLHALTQERASRIGYISTKTYIRYEYGERTMPLDTAVYYAKYYGVSLDYLAGVSNQMGQKPPQTVDIAPQLLNVLKHLTDEQQSRLADFLSSLKRK